MSAAIKGPTLPSHILNPLCDPFSQQSDSLLELYDLTQKPSPHPGQCLRCFYSLLEVAEPEKKKALAPLRQWLEEHLEILVNADGASQGSLPVRLEEPSLEGFCQGAIARVREDRVIRAQEISLELRYRSSRLAA